MGEDEALKVTEETEAPVKPRRRVKLKPPKPKFTAAEIETRRVEFNKRSRGGK